MSNMGYPSVNSMQESNLSSIRMLTSNHFSSTKARNWIPRDEWIDGIIDIDKDIREPWQNGIVSQCHFWW